MVIVDGKLTWGFERGDITFACPGRIAIQVALTAADTKKEGFRTEQTSVESMSQLPPGEHPGDNLSSPARQVPSRLHTVRTELGTTANRGSFTFATEFLTDSRHVPLLADR